MARALKWVTIVKKEQSVGATKVVPPRSCFVHLLRVDISQLLRNSPSRQDRSAQGLLIVTGLDHHTAGREREPEPRGAVRALVRTASVRP
jgi:hypothetical protein